MRNSTGASVPDQALAVPVEPASGLAPLGFDPSRGPFLIWSRRRLCWHRRDDDGCARGYTRDLMEAGRFDAKVALEYGDGVHNDAIALVDQLKPLADEVENRRLALEDAQERYERFSAIAMEARQGGDGETRLHPKDDSAGRQASPNGETPNTGGSHG